MRCVLFFIAFSCVCSLRNVVATATATHADALRESNEKFALKLINAIGSESAVQNVIISPVLVQAALTLLYYGASDALAPDLKSALNFDSFPNKYTATVGMAELLSSTKSKVGNRSHLANAIYVHDRFTFSFKDSFKETAKRFDTVTERVDLHKDTKALDGINYWFLKQTNFSIGELLPLASVHELHDDLHFLLASAATFKAPWATAFDAKETEKLHFHSGWGSHKLVDAMFVSHKFKYAEFEDLDAKAIELPFKGYDIKMLIIYPNKADGLSALEQKLQNRDLNTLNDQMSERKVALTLPKFKLETNIDLKPALNRCGFSKMFSNPAGFHNIFDALFDTSPPAVQRVQHKTLLEIDEAGYNEDCGFFTTFCDLFKRQQQLTISHPFFFAIKTNEVLLLAGHIAII